MLFGLFKGFSERNCLLCGLYIPSQTKTKDFRYYWLYDFTALLCQLIKISWSKIPLSVPLSKSIYINWTRQTRYEIWKYIDDIAVVLVNLSSYCGLINISKEIDAWASNYRAGFGQRKCNRPWRHHNVPRDY